MTAASTGPEQRRRLGATTRLAICLAVAVVAAAGCWLLTGRWQLALMALVTVTALGQSGSLTVALWGLDAAATEAQATREDVNHLAGDLIVAGVLVFGLVVITILIVGGLHRGGPADAILAVVSVVSSWALLHTTYACRYARLYYRDAPGGIDFNTEQQPCYQDFYYFAFNLGMTYQVSDTTLRSTVFRAAVLRHCLLSYVFGTMVLACTISLVLGLLA